MLIRSFSSLVSVVRLAPCGLRLCFLQGARLKCCSRRSCSKAFLRLLGIDFARLAHRSHKLLLGAQLPSTLIPPAKQVEHFVPLAVEFRFEFRQDCDCGAHERFLAFENVQIPDSRGVRRRQVVGEQTPEQRVEEV
jgi:hypothetical protein